MPASYPRRADHFKKWSQMMLEQALVPDRLEYKGTASKRSSSTSKSSNGGTRKSRKRRKRFLRRKRQKQE